MPPERFSADPALVGILTLLAVERAERDPKAVPADLSKALVDALTAVINGDPLYSEVPLYDGAPEPGAEKPWHHVSSPDSRRGTISAASSGRA